MGGARATLGWFMVQELHAGIRSSGPMVSYCGDDKKGPIAEVLEFFGQIQGPYLR
jgi:hypothetical protein